uniref:HAT C-terminal dimerisation domain-containing protein n=1 Tax=Crocodylus porosus TaxID=8502 RepID=A0A7M4G1Q5_CROPO
MSALNAKLELFLDKQCILLMALHYGIYGIKEDNLAKEKSNRATLSIPLSNFQHCSDHIVTLIDLYKLVCIGVTLPVSSATCEHSFSCLCQLKNFLRNTSGDSRASNLTLLSINSTRTKALMLLRTLLPLLQSFYEDISFLPFLNEVTIDNMIIYFIDLF